MPEVQGQGQSLVRPGALPHTLTDTSQARTLYSALIRAYGERAPRPQADPLDELIGTILSQHTSDTNSGRAYARLRSSFPTWPDVLAASEADIADAIRVGGLASTKARRIKDCLALLAGRYGEPTLRALAALDDATAASALTAIPGVGPKTAACVLLFALGRAVIPVDTHVHRVTRRLGIVTADASAEDVQRVLESLFPPDPFICYNLHVGLIAHGRQVCRARNPACATCSLANLCPVPGQARLSGPAQPHAATPLPTRSESR